MPSTEKNETPFPMMHIQVVFAAPTHWWRQCLDVPGGTTAEQAVALSGFAQAFPEYTDTGPPPLGVFGERCAPQRVLRDGDRVELYRPLVFDPLESRRRRAVHKKNRLGIQSRRQPPR